MSASTKRQDTSLYNRRRIEKLDNSFNKYGYDVAARPVDTFVRSQPMLNAGNNYAMLAQSLSSISPKLVNLIDKKRKEQEEAEIARGTKLYHEAGSPRLSWKDYRDMNPDMKGVNQNVKHGFLKARMLNEAHIFRTSLYDAYYSGRATATAPDGRTVSLAEVGTSGAFEAWAGKFVQEYIKDSLGDDHDPQYFAEIFAPQLENTMRELSSRHIAHHNEVLMNKNITEHAAVIEAVINTAIEDGIVTTDSDEALQVSSNLSRIAFNMHSSGLPQGETGKALMNQFVAIAKRSDLVNGEDLIGIAKNVMLSEGVSFWDTDNNGAELTRLIDSIKAQQQYAKNAQRQEEREAEEKAEKEATSELYIMAMRGARITPAFRDEFVRQYGWRSYHSVIQSVDSTKRGAGGGVGSASKAAKSQQEALGTELLKGLTTKIATGEDINLSEYSALIPWLTPEHRTKLFKTAELYNAPVESGFKEAQTLFTEMVKTGITADSLAIAQVIDASPDEILYVQNIANQTITDEAYKLLKSYRSTAATDPQKIISFILDKSSQSIADTLKHAPALIKNKRTQGYGAYAPTVVQPQQGTTSGDVTPKVMTPMDRAAETAQRDGWGNMGTRPEDNILMHYLQQYAVEGHTLN